MKISFAPRVLTAVYEEQIAALLSIIGHPEALVTDMSTFYDFLGFGVSDAVAQETLDELLSAAQISVPIGLNDTLVEACQKLQLDNPSWPRAKVVQ